MEDLLDVVEVRFLLAPILLISGFNVPVSPSELFMFICFHRLVSAEGIDLDFGVFLAVIVCAKLGYRVDVG